MPALGEDVAIAPEERPPPEGGVADHAARAGGGMPAPREGVAVKALPPPGKEIAAGAGATASVRTRTS